MSNREVLGIGLYTRPFISASFFKHSSSRSKQHKLLLGNVATLFCTLIPVRIYHTKNNDEHIHMKIRSWSKSEGHFMCYLWLIERAMQTCVQNSRLNQTFKRKQKFKYIVTTCVLLTNSFYLYVTQLNSFEFRAEYVGLNASSVKHKDLSCITRFICPLHYCSLM